MCCKPSSEAGVVWMETTLERLGSTPSHEEWQPPQGDHTKQLLYQGAEKLEERKFKESLCTEKVERKVVGLIPTDDQVFRPFFTSKTRNDDEFHSCAYSALIWSNHCKLWQNLSDCNQL